MVCRQRKDHGKDFFARIDLVPIERISMSAIGWFGKDVSMMGGLAEVRIWQFKLMLEAIKRRMDFKTSVGGFAQMLFQPPDDIIPYLGNMQIVGRWDYYDEDYAIKGDQTQANWITAGFNYMLEEYAAMLFLNAVIKLEPQAYQLANNEYLFQFQISF
jgi:hypothetical protein